MGVKACFRKGCDNILCDRLSSVHGYICYECFNELVNLGADTDIINFMNSQKTEIVKQIDAFDIFDSEFPLA